MIPKPGKKYVIACMGPFDYNRWAGVGTYTGRSEPYDEDLGLAFTFETKDGDIAFVSDDIIEELP